MNLDRRYLKRRGESWYLKLPIPRPIRHLYPNGKGRPSEHIEEALKTRDLREANRLKHARLAFWTRDFHLKAQQAAGTLPPDLAEAARLREALRDAESADERESYIFHRITPKAEEIEERSGDAERAVQFHRLATAKETLREAWEKWMKVNDHNKATKLKDEQAFRSLLEFLGVADALPMTVTGERARAYVEWLNTKAVSARGGPLSKATKEGRIAPLRIFWNDYLAYHELVPEGFNPWRNPKLTGRRKSTEEQPDRKRPYTEDELLALLNGPELRGKGVRYPKRTLMEAFALCFFTGARIGEIANRRLGDVEKITGGYLLHIRTGKTDDAPRSIPIYNPIPVAVLKRRIGKRKDARAQLFEEFIPGGPNASLGWYVSKALGHYRDKVGLGTATDTHSTRRQLITLLHSKKVPEVLVNHYTGHKPRGMAGPYAKPTPEGQRTVARAIRYPQGVERAFRTALVI